MKIDIGALIRGEVDSVVFDYEMMPEAIDDVDFTGNAKISGRISGNAGYMRLVLTLSVPYRSQCARCLDEVVGIFEATLERTCVTEKSVSPEELEENEDEYILIKEGSVEPDEAVNATVYFEFPKKLICDENCKGLCPICGKKLSDGHNCEKNENKLDRRFAILEKVLDKD